MPATFDSVWEFLGFHMYVANDMKIVADKKKVNDRTDALVAFINAEAPPAPSNKRKASEEPVPRACPRGMPWCMMECNYPLGKYRKICDGCVAQPYL